MKKKPLLTAPQGFILSILLISLIMTAVMTVGMALFMNPNDEHLAIHIWESFLLGSVIAIPTGFVIVPLVQKIVERLTT